MADFTVDDVLADYESEGSFTVDDILADYQPSQEGLPGVPSTEFLPPSRTQQPARDPSVGTGEFLGGTAMSLATSKLPTVVSAPLVGLGSAGGEAVEQIAEHITGNKEAPKTSTEAIKRLAIAGGRGFVGEAGGRGLLKYGGKAFRTIKPRPTPSPEEQRAIKLIESVIPPITERGKLNPLRYLLSKDYSEKLSLLPGEATSSRGIKLLHNVSEASLFGGGNMATVGAKRGEGLTNFADDIVDAMGEQGTAGDIASLFKHGVEKNINASKAGASIIFNKAEDLAKNTPITLKKTKSFIKPMMEVSKELNSGDDIVKLIASIDDNISYGAAKALRTKLFDIVNAESIANPKASSIGAAKKLIGELTSDIQSSLKSGGQNEALRLIKRGNELVVRDKELFNNRFIRGLVRKADDIDGTPEQIVSTILKNKATSNVRRAKAALGGRHTKEWNQFQSFFTRDIVEKSTDIETGVLSGKKILGHLRGMSKETLREIYTPGQLNSIQELGNALKITQGDPLGGTGKMFIKLSQAGVVMSMPMAGVGVEAASIVIAPKVFSMIFTHPVIANKLIHGLKAGTKSKIAAGAMGRFMTDLVDMEQAGKFTPSEQKKEVNNNAR